MLNASTSGRGIAYLDSSALIKLVIAEPESAALREALRSWPGRASSRLAIVEVLRTVRLQQPAAEPLARRVLRGVALLRITDRILVTAGTLDPPRLRSLDAIHLATALQLQPLLVAFASYDGSQLQAAEAAGLPTLAPR